MLQVLCTIREKRNYLRVCVLNIFLIINPSTDTVIQEKAFTPLIKDESELPKGSDQGGPELYKAGQLPR